DYAFPLWSPDGTKLSAQVTTQNGMASQLAIIEAITGAEKRVGWDSGVIATWSWSPDGSRIIFAGDDARTWQHDFFIYDVASGEITRVTDDLASLPVGGMPGDAAPFRPVWLDDRQVMFHAIRA